MGIGFDNLIIYRQVARRRLVPERLPAHNKQKPPSPLNRCLKWGDEGRSKTAKNWRGPARAAELPIWLHRYNWHRPHGGIKYKTPISRLALTEDNLLRLHN